MNKKEAESSKEQLLEFINSRVNSPWKMKPRSYEALVNELFNTRKSYLEEFVTKINAGIPEIRTRAIKIESTLKRVDATPRTFIQKVFGSKALGYGRWERLQDYFDKHLWLTITLLHCEDKKEFAKILNHGLRQKEQIKASNPELWEQILQLNKHYQVEALKIPGVVHLLVNEKIQWEQILQLNKHYQVAALKIPEVVHMLVNEKIQWEQILQLNNRYKVDALEIPEVRQLLDRNITWDHLLQLNNHYQVGALEIPEVRQLLDINITWGRLLQLNNNWQLEALQIPEVLELLADGNITLKQISLLNDYFQVKALKRSEVRQLLDTNITWEQIIQLNNDHQVAALKIPEVRQLLVAKTITGKQILQWDQILRLDNHNQLAALKIPEVLLLLVSGNITFKQILQLNNHYQVHVLKIPGVRQLLDKSITWDQIVQLDNYNQVQALEIPEVCQQLVAKIITWEVILRLNDDCQETALSIPERIAAIRKTLHAEEKKELESNVTGLYIALYNILPEELIRLIATMSVTHRVINYKEALHYSGDRYKQLHQDRLRSKALPSCELLIKQHVLFNSLTSNSSEPKDPQQQHEFDKLYGLTVIPD